MTIDLGLDIAQSLTAIVVLYRDLEEEALHRYADKDIPGGDALVMLGPVANLEAYGYRQLSELMGRTNVKGGLEDQATDDAPPLLVLAGWTEVLRAERWMEPETKRATITHEADFIRSSIDWMLAEDEHGTPNFMPADELAKDLRRVRARLENVLKAGERADRIKAECKTCTESPRLAVKHGEASDKSDDSWYCPNCEMPYDVDGVRACWRQMLVKRGDAPEWVTVMQASTALARSPKSIRNWMRTTNTMGHDIKPKVMSRESDGVQQVRWSDVRAVDDMTHRRGRHRNAA